MDGQLPARKNQPLATPKLRSDLADVVKDVLPLADASAVAVAALATGAVCLWLDPGLAAAELAASAGRLTLGAAVLAPLMLCNRQFLAGQGSERATRLGLCFGLRLAACLAALGLLARASGAWSALPEAWPAIWIAGIVLLTALSRLSLVRGLEQLERRGLLRETVAVLGAGRAADRVIHALAPAPGGKPIEIVGVFDDRSGRHESAVHRPDGSVADLIELGKRRELDWIVLALPDATEARVQALLHRLMSLATPVCLCAPGAAIPTRARPRPAPAREALRLALPGWLRTLATWPVEALGRLLEARGLRTRGTAAPLGLALDRHDLEGFSAIAARFGQARYGYVVTANVDHVIRLHRWPALRRLYADAAYALLDSRFLAHVLRAVRGLRWPVCAGSDLTARLLQEAGSHDRIVLIGGSEAQATRLAARYGLERLVHYNPPMGFIRDPAAIEACLAFIEQNSPFRYCLLAVGSPQQEFVAYCLKQRGVARGLALCIGASVDFLTGAERRAPGWMQAAGVEWLFRLLQSPRRMAYRYLVRGPRIFALLARTEIVDRGARPMAVVRDIPRAVAAPELALEIETSTVLPFRRKPAVPLASGRSAA